MGIHLDKGKAAITLKPCLNNISKILKQRHQIVLCRIRGQIANVARSLPLRRLAYNHIIALYTVCREMMMTAEGRHAGARAHAHGGHSLLLGDTGLSLLVCPIAADCARAKPLTVHGTQSLLSVGSFPESDETIAARTAGLHVPHHTSFRKSAEGGKGLEENIVVYVVGEVADEDVEVACCVFFVGTAGLVGPIDTDFLETVVRQSVRGRSERKLYGLPLERGVGGGGSRRKDKNKKEQGEPTD